MEYKFSNNHMHSDSKKHRSFLALLFAAGDVKRYASNHRAGHRILGGRSFPAPEHHTPMECAKAAGRTANASA